ncbi:pyrimidodiazepine synthase-like [Drosophila sulfurigaster albostrigata]|uniref:pyrimidodiazepine synthase-like n=1 Tax=Drosophila sulfurigaster albostrigata TaxID=89887 RepID=UPI002D21CFE7|nr:pyrimidodiazepine synthase-like [Drosophila sulfurigaster albostrigata]
MSAGKHLGKGSVHPALPDDGVPRLYSMRFCPFAERAHLALNAKKVPHHTIYVNLIEKPEWLVDVSPLLKVPALHLVGEKEQPSLIESLIIVEYLDEKYPENPLLPKDPLKRAQDKILVERFNALTGAFMKIALQGGDGADFWPALDIFENELGKRGTPYFSGEKPGFADYMIWPWLERLPVAEYFLKERYNFDKQRYAKISAWLELIVKDEVVQSHYATPEQHLAYWRSREAGKINYDLLA